MPDLKVQTNLKAIGRRIAELRDGAGLTQEALASDIGVKRSTIANIETGGDRAGIVSIVALADYFKVPLDWLLCRKPPLGGPAVGKFVDDPDELAWLRFWEDMDEPERRAVTVTLGINRPSRSDAA